jgi:hypothetical protein
MRALVRLLAPLFLALAMAGPLLAAPSTAEYLGWLETRRLLWVQEMKRMESHEHGQYRAEYRRLSEKMTAVRETAQVLKSAQGAQEAILRQELFLNVGEVEQGLEFLLSETPELAEEQRPVELPGPVPR